MTLRIELSRLAKILDQILNPPTDHLHKCPRCTQGVSPGDECCVHCGFSITVMDEQYGSDAVLLDRVTDAAGVLSEPELDRLNEALVEYERQFPQLFATVYCGALPQQSSLRQFGFWLLNRAAVCDVDATRPNEHGTALVLDIHGRAAFLLHGYLVRGFYRYSLKRFIELTTSVLEKGWCFFNTIAYPMKLLIGFRSLMRA